MKKKFHKMVCLRCDGTKFKDITKRVYQEYKGKKYWVSTSVTECQKCGWTTVRLEQLNEMCSKMDKKIKKP